MADPTDKRRITSFHAWVQPDEPDVSEAAAPDHLPIDRFELVTEATRDFNTSMTFLRRFIDDVGRASMLTGLTHQADLMALASRIALAPSNRDRDTLANIVVRVEFDEGEDTKTQDFQRKVPLRDASDARHAAELSISHQRTIELLHQTAIQQIVVIHERLLAELVFHAALADSKRAYDDDLGQITFTLSDVLSMKSIQHAKDMAAYKQAEKFLDGKYQQQLNHLKDKLRVDLKHLCSSEVPIFEDVVLRRHAIVHGTSFSDHKYGDERRKIKGLADRDRAESAQSVSHEYLQIAWQSSFALGVIAGHATLHKIADHTKTTDQELRTERQDTADDMLVNASFACIKEGAYQPALQILEYYLSGHHSNRGSDYEIQLRAKINKAQALKRSGNKDQCERELTLLSPQSHSMFYRLCISSLQEDYDLFYKLLPDVASTGEVTLARLCDWPVFKEMRQRDDFRIRAAKVYGVEPTDIPTTGRPALVLAPSSGMVADAFSKLKTSDSQ